jgi:polyhydroxyalkanoate synthesis regulator phasin
MPEKLLESGEASQFDERWKQVQGEFVDHPREAVEQADKLVADLMQKLQSEFSQTRAGLERQWESSDDVSTEDLRVAMTRYRSFFERLLAA